jgi:hypothetical protein
MPVPMISVGELASLQREGLRAMPDTATILRNTPVRTPGGYTQNFLPVGTTRCRLSASVLSGGNEQQGAGELVAVLSYTLTVPPGTDIKPADRIQVGTSLFEVNAVKGDASWNMSDAITLSKLN